MSNIIKSDVEEDEFKRETYWNHSTNCVFSCLIIALSSAHAVLNQG